MKTTLDKVLNYFVASSLFIILAAQLFGCASTPYLKGVHPSGEKAYLGPVEIENTDAFKSYLASDRTEVHKQKYLFSRLRKATDLEYFRNGSWYSADEAYRGGMWLVKHKYKAGQDSRQFIKLYIERSEDKNQYHLVKYPDGTVQIGSYVLLNELDLLEAKAAKK